MKKLTRILALSLAVVMLCLSLAACGEKPATTQNTFTTIRVSRIDAMNWYTDEVFTLKLNSDSTYELTCFADRFGGEDFDMRGVRTLIYTGKYTIAASADGEPSHKDVSLEAATEISWEQHGKGFSRVPVMPGTFYVNTSAWTAEMSAVYDPENSTKGAADFLAEFAKPMTLTVEDPSTDLEDTTLAYRLVTLPDTSDLFDK
ncbi:MAG: hypothetical protein ACSW8F_03670 [bacterium]